MTRATFDPRLTPAPAAPPGVHLNGSANTPRPRATRLWPALIFVLLALNASIVAVTLYFALSDRSAATEPDYYRKAMAYDETIRLREESARLGWKAMVTFRPAADGRSMQLAVTLTDRDDRPIEGARVQAEAFASARSGDRQTLDLAPIAGQEPGTYAAPIRVSRAGVWHVRLHATRADDHFAHEAEAYLFSNPS